MAVRLQAIVIGIFVATLAGCGSAATAPRLSGPAKAATPIEADFRLGGIPKNFTVVEGEVIKLLPPDTQGLPHQKFLIRVFQPFEGKILEVAHNTAAAPPVPDLRVGEPLLIRGVIYSGAKDGIHWTHHAAKPGDAGFIQTVDGEIYE